MRTYEVYSTRIVEKVNASNVFAARGEREPEMHQTKKGGTQADQLLHGKEKRVRGDAGYCGIAKREAQTDREVEWQIVMRPGKRAKLVKGNTEDEAKKEKASVGAKVAYACFYSIRMFGYNRFAIAGWRRTRTGLAVGWFYNLLRAEPCMAA